MKDYNEMAESLFERRKKYLTERKKKINALIKAASGLGCLCLAALSGLWILNGNPVRETDYLVNITPVAMEEAMHDPQAADADRPGSNGISDLQNDISLPKDTENAAGNEQASSESSMDLASGKLNTEKEHKDSLPEAQNPNTESGSPDIPVSEQSPGSLQHITVSGGFSDFFGGSYTNSQGLLCILLTSDTPENRSAICREFNLKESNIVFQKADYTLSYLTRLHAIISEGMISRELNFVTSSSLREDTNRIHLTVTTEDTSRLEKLMALDSLGGAIVIEYQPDGDAMKDLLIEKKNTAP